MSARLLRLQTSDEAQAGFGAEQLKVLLNAFFEASSLILFFIAHTPARTYSTNAGQVDTVMFARGSSVMRFAS